MIFSRVSAIVFLMPVFATFGLPARVKLALSLCISVICAHYIELPVRERGFVELLPMLMVEGAIGLALGFSLRLFVFALQIAGTIIGLSTSLSQVLGATGPDPLPALGKILIVSSAALAIALGLHVKFVEFVLLSYELFPFAHAPDPSLLTPFGIQKVAQSFALAFSLAAPFVGLALLYNIAIGAINRAMPQLMVAFVGAPFITFCAILLLTLASPVLIEVWRDALLGFMSDPRR